ncbi:MAG: hypothetical protein Q8S20_19655 [Sulfuritalea sp.]|nr:hypothetical protein [Sulfuritalea sp.]
MTLNTRKRSALKRSSFSRDIAKPEGRSAFIPAVASIIAAAIALTGALFGTFVGQRMNATTESDKTVRVKLEEAYSRTISLPSLAEDVNMAVLNLLTPANYLGHAGEYNGISKRYREEIFKIVAISDLYETALSPAAKALAECGNRFNVAASEHFLLRAMATGAIKVAGYESHKLISPEEIIQSQNDLVRRRLDCVEVGNQVRKAIAATMKSHM